MNKPWHGRPVVYRCYAADGSLLYVGSSVNVEGRMIQHRRDSFWFRQTARVRIAIFTSEMDARTAERVAIHNERPRFNLNHRAPRSTWTVDDFRDVITALRRNKRPGLRGPRISALKRELAARLEGVTA